MPRYRVIYGDNDQVVRETLDRVDIEREDGWIAFFRGSEAILRVHEDHVQSLELLAGGNMPEVDTNGTPGCV